MRQLRLPARRFFLSRRFFIPGLMFLVGRQLYSMEYVKDPKTRLPGMSLTLLANVILLVGIAVGLVLRMI